MNEYLQIFNQLSRSDRSEQRIELAKRFAWAVPNQEALQYLVSLSPIIEIGAGSGYWAHLVQEAGGVIRAFDEQPYENCYCSNKWTEVEFGDPSTVAEYPDHTLFLCWPPMSRMAYECLINYSGDRVVYIGDVDGCTGCDWFDFVLKQDWVKELTIDIPRYPGVYDFLFSYRRK
ncbi:MAG: hypothetical protein KME23_08120 [Goleter apudmare HA4340-LM2]|nr:hypothetical protein [Goleter apudmare HA4340-LM2]